MRESKDAVGLLGYFECIDDANAGNALREAAGWLKIMLGLPRLKRYLLFALGVLPEYQGKGIDNLIYRALYEALYTPDIWLEINLCIKMQNAFAF